jgi:hypothetical protein
MKNLLMIALSILIFPKYGHSFTFLKTSINMYPLHMSDGWNLISVRDVETSYSRLAQQCENGLSPDIYTWDASAQTFRNLRSIDPGLTLRPRESYWIRSLGACSANVPNNYKTTDLTPQELVEGWNLVGGRDKEYPMMASHFLSDCKIQGNFGIRYKNEEMERASEFKIGKGTWVYVPQPCTLFHPDYEILPDQISDLHLQAAAGQSIQFELPPQFLSQIKHKDNLKISYTKTLEGLESGEVNVVNGDNGVTSIQALPEQKLAPYWVLLKQRISNGFSVVYRNIKVKVDAIRNINTKFETIIHANGVESSLMCLRGPHENYRYADLKVSAKTEVAGVKQKVYEANVFVNSPGDEFIPTSSTKEIREIFNTLDVDLRIGGGSCFFYSAPIDHAQYIEWEVIGQDTNIMALNVTGIGANINFRGKYSFNLMPLVEENFVERFPETPRTHARPQFDRYVQEFSRDLVEQSWGQVQAEVDINYAGFTPYLANYMSLPNPENANSKFYSVGKNCFRYTGCSNALIEESLANNNVLKSNYLTDKYNMHILSPVFSIAKFNQNSSGSYTPGCEWCGTTQNQSGYGHTALHETLHSFSANHIYAVVLPHAPGGSILDETDRSNAIRIKSANSVMGSGWVGTQIHPITKSKLGWYNSEDVILVKESGRYIIKSDRDILRITYPNAGKRISSLYISLSGLDSNITNGREKYADLELADKFFDRTKGIDIFYSGTILARHFPNRPFDRRLAEFFSPHFPGDVVQSRKIKVTYVERTAAGAVIEVVLTNPLEHD